MIVAWPAAVLCALWTLARLLGLESAYPLVPLLAYTPYVVPVAALTAIASGFMRRWIPMSIAVASGAVLIALIAPRALGNEDPGDGTPIRVMAANLHGGKADPEQLLELIRELRVDVLAVQELTPEFAGRFAEVGVRDELPHAVSFPRESERGSGIYSRSPAEPMGPEDRHFLQARAAVLVRGLMIDVTSVHATPPTGTGGVSSWAADLDSFPAPDRDAGRRLLLGDFNATLDHSKFRELLDRGYADAAERTGKGLTATWPTSGRWNEPFRWLPVTIDHLLFEREDLGARDYQVLEIEGSDHRAVYAELVAGS